MNHQNHVSRDTNNHHHQGYLRDLSKTQKDITLLPLGSIERQQFMGGVDASGRNLLRTFPELIPTYKVAIDDQIFYLCPQPNFDTPRYSHKVFFAYKNGTYHLRVTRFSGSGQKTMMFPGYDSSKKSRMSKGDVDWGLDYESGTVLDKRLEQAIHALPSTQKPIDEYLFADHLYQYGYTSDNYETREGLKEFSLSTISTNTHGRNGQTPALIDVRDVLKIHPHEMQKKYASNPRETFEKYIFPRIPFDKKIIDGHNIIKMIRPMGIRGDTEFYEACIGSVSGKPLIALLARKVSDRPDLFWVESIEVFGSKITSFGIPKDRVSSGLYTAKPADYFLQIPGYIQQDLRRQHPSIEYYSDDIVDIREYIQGNPIIVALKKTLQHHGIRY